MKKENALKVIGVSLLCPLLFIGAQIVVSLVYQLIYAIAHSAELQADLDAFLVQMQTALTANTMYVALVSIVLFFAILFIIFRVRGESLSERVRWNPVPLPIYGLVAIATLTGLIFINVVINNLMPENVIADVDDYSAPLTSGGFVMAAIVGALLAPIGEEISFRGFMMTRLQMRFPVGVAVALSAVVFSLGHFTGGIGQLIGTLWLGVFFCLVFLWTKSLRASILAHVLNNAVALLIPGISWIFEMSLPVELIIGLVSLVATLFVLFLIYKRRVMESEPLDEQIIDL